MKKLLCLVLAIAAVFSLSVNAFANAAEPPCLTLITGKDSADTEFWLEIGGEKFEPQKKIVAWETYYRFYNSEFYDVSPDEKVFIVAKTADEEIRYELEHSVRFSYRGIMTFDPEEGFYIGQNQWRIPLLVSMRVAATIIIELAVLLLFRIRRAKSILCFLCINLVTQGLLNAFITGPTTGYVGMLLYILEPLIIIAEAAAFYFLVPEFEEKFGKRRFAVLYALAANIASWILGGWMISNLPI